MLSVFSEFEISLRKERQAEGIAKAKEKGVKFGRPTKVKEEMKQAILADIADSSMSVRAILKKYDITCSDLDVPKSYIDARKIFGEFDYKKLNILNTSLTDNYNCIIALGLVYAFSTEDYKNFFNNVNRSLNLHGELILDSSSSENNFITFLFDRLYLKYETFFISKILNFLGKTNSVVTRHHGYKFKNNEIIKIAQKHGFSLISKESKDNLTEISRSKILRFICSVLGT